MSAAPTTLMICVTCQDGDSSGAERPGAQLHRQMEAALTQRSDVQLKAVECMSVCKRACTIAVSAPGKWTYVIGDLDPAADMSALSDYLDAYTRDPNGTPPLKQRPVAIRSGTISRIPPLTHKDPYAAS